MIVDLHAVTKRNIINTFTNALTSFTSPQIAFQKPTSCSCDSNCP